MKNLAMFVVMVYVAAGLCACGGGGGGGGDITTPVGTTVNLTAFKGVVLGTSTGSQYNFPSLTGTDSQGRSWSGAYSIVALGATTFETQNVTRADTSVTLRLATGTPVTSVGSRYCFISDGSIYKSVSSAGIISLPVTQFPFPTIQKVGDFGVLGTFNLSDGTTATSTWSLNAGVNGTSQFVISSVIKSGTTVTGTETDTFTLDAQGNPTSFAVSVTANGLTLNLTGNRV